MIAQIQSYFEYLLVLIVSIKVKEFYHCQLQEVVVCKSSLNARKIYEVQI